MTTIASTSIHRLDDEQLVLQPHHPRFEPSTPSPVLSLGVDFKGGETAQIQVHGLQGDEEPTYELVVEEIDPSNGGTAARVWKTNGTYCVSREIRQKTDLALKLTARPTSPSAAGSLTGTCTIHIRSKGLGDD